MTDKPDLLAERDGNRFANEVQAIENERDAAMANADKACEENTRLREALAPFAVLGCSDGNCAFRDSRGGQHTNGGCRCLGRSQQTRREKLGELIEGAREALASVPPRGEKGEQDDD